MSILLGCGAFDVLHYVQSGKTDAALADWTQKWLALYNYATLPFYWGLYEPVEGQPEFKSRMEAALLLREHDVTVKGHPLC